MFTDTERMDYLEEHPYAFFTYDPDEAPNVIMLNERDGPDLKGVMGLGSGPTLRAAIDDSISAEQYGTRQRCCKAVGCDQPVAFAGYCSTACFLDPNGEGY